MSFLPPPPRLASCLPLTALLALGSFAALSRPALAQETLPLPAPPNFEQLRNNPPPPPPALLPTEGEEPDPVKLISNGEIVFAADQVVVKFKSNVAETAIRSLLLQNGMVQRSYIRATGWRLLTVPGPLNATWFIALLNNSPLVERAEVNLLITTAGTPPVDEAYVNDINGSNFQWNLRKIGMEAAWERTRGGTYATAVIDSGISTYNTKDLLPKILRDSQGNLLGKAYTQSLNSSGYEAEDDQDIGNNIAFGHGSFVSGIIGAATAFSGSSFNTGMAGVNPYGKILPIKTLDYNGSDPDQYNGYHGTSYRFAKAITYAANASRTYGVRVINASVANYPTFQSDQTIHEPSVGTEPSYAQSILDALKVANDNGLIFVSVMGNYEGAFNDNPNKITYPAAYWRTMAIGSTDINDNVSSFSRRGSHVSVVAPGANIYSARRDGTYGINGGTSFAAPHVAGLAGLLLEEFPSMTWWDLRYHIEDTADYINGQTGFDFNQGWGRINADKATQAIFSPQEWPATTNLPAQQLLISIPAWFLSPNPADTVANRAQDVALMFPGANAQVAWYDPTISGYRPYSDLSVPRMGPGRGYFVQFSSPVSTVYAATLPFQKPTHRMPVHLKPGYNLIGVPGHNPITWNRQTFHVATENKPGGSDRRTEGHKIELDFQGAIDAGWIDVQPMGFNYNVASGPTQYYPINVGDTLQPGLGYLIRAYIECEILIPSS